jgi:hypothetical protein
MTQTAPHTARLRLVAAFLLVGLAALLPRLLDLGGFATNDEVNFWLGRSERFLQALQTGDFAATAISTHPGVTTMWLGSVGILLRRGLLAWGLVQEVPFPLLLALMRLPVALVHTGGVLLGYALLRRMLPASVALLAALLWAADPFVIGYSRLLHVDALLATFATLSLLAACVSWHHGGDLVFVVLSAACGALAVLSKSPGLALLPVVVLLALLQGMGTRGWGVVWPLLLWGGVFAMTIAFAWPAVWADLPGVYGLLRLGVEGEGAQPHMLGNFFLGEAVETPGPLFYPAAVALRLTPWTLAGLLLLPLAWQWGDLSPTQRRDLLLLVGFALFFTLAMTLFPKKINRYLLPIFPALDILAAVGLVWGIGWLARAAQRQRQAVVGAGVALLAAVALLNAAWWHPYGLAAFNQALGGVQAGARTFSVGWGEGFGQVAAWLNRQPDITGVVTASIMTTVLNPYLRHGAQASTPAGDTLPDQTGYVVVYIYQAQGTVFPPFDQFYRRAAPLHTVTIHGVEYAWVYQVPPPVAHQVDARFGQHISLRGYEVDSSALRASGVLSLTVQWRADAPPPDQDYLLFAHVLDASGQRVAQVDVLPAGPDMPPTTWQPGRVITWAHPIPLPADLPPGTYWLALGLYDPDDFTRLPVAPEPPPAAPAAGGNALLLPITIEAGEGTE